MERMLPCVPARVPRRLAVAAVRHPAQNVGVELQRLVGNRAVTRLAADLRLQAKLAINQPGDVLEQEADRVADQVMRMSDSPASPGCECGGTCADCAGGGDGRDAEAET